MKLVLTIIVAIVGIWNLFSKEPINKFSYFVMWFLLLLHLITEGLMGTLFL